MILFLICCGSTNSGVYAFMNSPMASMQQQMVSSNKDISSTKLNSSEQPSDTNDVRLTTSRRRQMLIQLAGVLTATTVQPILSANADPSLVSSIQGPIQDIIAPGHWIGQFLPLNSKTERWKFVQSSAEVSSALVGVLNELTPERKAKLLIPNFTISTQSTNHIHVITWTKNEWLDSLDVTLKDNGSGSGSGCIATASFYATGFLPTSIPLAPIVNVGMSWFPFASPGPRGEMLQDFRLRAIHGLLDKKLQQD